jgi:hypothetical protein
MKARQRIAFDLGVDIKNIAFVRQKDFHIDMFMFVDPSGDRVYVDRSAVNHSLIRELQKIHCEVIAVPGVHQVAVPGVHKVRDCINFMNGIFVSTPTGPLFVTNGVKDDKVSIRLRNLFSQKIASMDPGFKVHFLDETQEFLTDFMGGIHCLTWERRHCATPFDIVFSYLDEGIPEQRIRKATGKVLASLDTPLPPFRRPIGL